MLHQKRKGVHRNGQFPPGKSGNPAGRVSIPRNYRELCAHGGEIAVQRLIECVMRETNTAYVASAARFFLEFAYGKPRQDISIESPIVEGMSTSQVMERLRAKLVEYDERKAKEKQLRLAGTDKSD